MSHKKSKFKSAQSTMEYILCCMIFAGVSVGMVAGLAVGMGGFTNANQAAGQQSADRLTDKLAGHTGNSVPNAPATNTGEEIADAEPQTSPVQ